MSKITVEQSDIIDARPEEVYAILLDYRVEHPAILPKPYFAELVIEQGGHGAGTVYRLRMDIWGRQTVYHMTVTEPEPGRVIRETDVNTGLATTFTIDPVDGGTRSRLTIATESPATPGMMGIMERLVQPSILRRIYKQELQILGGYVKTRRAPAQAG